jgi:hypothetical protein
MTMPEWLKYLYTMASWFFLVMTCMGVWLLCMKRNIEIRKQLASITIAMALFFLIGTFASLIWG